MCILSYELIVKVVLRKDDWNSNPITDVPPKNWGLNSTWFTSIISSNESVNSKFFQQGTDISLLKSHKILLF